MEKRGHNFAKHLMPNPVWMELLPTAAKCFFVFLLINPFNNFLPVSKSVTDSPECRYGPTHKGDIDNIYTYTQGRQSGQKKQVQPRGKVRNFSGQFFPRKLWPKLPTFGVEVFTFNTT